MLRREFTNEKEICCIDVICIMAIVGLLPIQHTPATAEEAETLSFDKSELESYVSDFHYAVENKKAENSTVGSHRQ